MARPERIDRFLTIGTQLELAALVTLADGTPVDFSANGTNFEITFRKDWLPTVNPPLWILSLSGGSITIDPGNSSRVVASVEIPNVFTSTDVKYVWIWDIVLDGKRYPLLRGIVTVGY